MYRHFEPLDITVGDMPAPALRGALKLLLP
jgi:hypothetical protein